MTGLVLIVVDSLRHDLPGCAGGPAVTPTLDALAGQGILCERVISAAPWTVPAIASLLTGVYSHRLGLAQWKQPWPAEHPTLFRLATRSGLEAASFVFDPEHLFSRLPEANVQGSSQEPQAVLAWLRRRRGEPFVLLVHYWWTHIPYLSVAMSTAAWRQLTDRVLAAMRDGGAAAREGVKRLYRLAVERFSEEWLPPLLEAIDLDRTFVVVTSDHGESWGERDGSRLDDVFDLHGHSLHDEVLRVPLIVRPPGGCAPRRVPQLVRSVDLLPTLAALLGLGDEPPGLDGVSLAALLERGEGPAPGDAVSAMSRDVLLAPEVPADPAELWAALALTTPDRKLIWCPRSGARQAFDLRRDPGEEVDLGGQGNEAGWARLESELRRARARPIPHSPDPVEERLRQLGYLE